MDRPGAGGAPRAAQQEIVYRHPDRTPSAAAGRAFRWVPACERVEIAGKLVPGGLFYLGQELRAPTGEVEPSLIDAGLPIDRANPDRRGEHVPEQPSYARLPPARGPRS